MTKFLKPTFILILLLVTLTSCEKDKDDYVDITLQTNLEKQLNQLFGSKENLILPDSDDYLAIPNDIKNPITQAKVNLGKLLYHETGLAKSPTQTEGMNTYSCASCHHVDAGFQSGIKQGIGEGGFGFGYKGQSRVMASSYTSDKIDVQPIRTPSVLNVAYQDVMLWNGQFGATGTNANTQASWTPNTPKAENNLGFEGVEIQAIAGLNVHRLSIDENFIKTTEYKTLFDAAFPKVSLNKRYSRINAGLAIAAYERTLLPNKAPFQMWLKGSFEAMSDEELLGASIFFGKGQCYTCHSGPGLNGMGFHALGMNDLSGNNVAGIVDEATQKGRGGFTGNSADDYKFKTPQLYNLKDVNFLGHGGSFSSVKDVVIYKNNAVKENENVPTSKLSAQFTPLGLTEAEIEQLTTFLEKSLYDANLIRYVPNQLPSGNCFPNADSQSSIDMGCN
ncbi:cytochrome-c peroxidase [Seonamhaeicola algicola]|uniref:Cytochrome-c peroxidase n=1 Tax=Seonamhaeicola algicola TaxID=1719036 RepID=A0A5C7AKQ7_9FLAO|nr:cytochrome c peroxidase [Seonamhaeicola algicola]TXE06372.1 cytochrome-c peroxidase [Seonamhaeicola algicola]